MKPGVMIPWFVRGICVSIAALAANPVFGQTLVGSAFTYQGKLEDGGLPANGAYDFEYRLFDDDDAGAQVGSTLKSGDLVVDDGLFTVKLDFGAVYNGNARWLEISVRQGASTGAYTVLTPRQELTGAPFAMGLRLPMSQDVISNFGSAFYVSNGGLSPAGHFVHTNTFIGDALVAEANGIGGANAIQATQHGTGDCGYFIVDNVDSFGNPLRAETIGKGDVIEATNEGTGRAAYFEITETSNDSPALEIQTAGPGPAVLSYDPIQILGETGDDAEPGSGGHLIVGDIASTNIAIDNNEIMARSNGTTATLFLNNDGGEVFTGGPLSVKGKVLCEELEVQLYEDWPDFVFEDGYALMPLSEVEARIKAQGHLPGVPSAQTIREEGINVGSMQAQLLQKIEELTLHMIELDKQVSSMRDENIRLKGHLAQLTGLDRECEVNP